MKTRKRLISIFAVLALGFAALAGLVGLLTSTGAAAAPWQKPAEQILNPMPALAEADCTTVGDTVTCDLWAAAGSLTLPDGATVPVWGFAAAAGEPGQVPGPVIRAALGQTLVINLHNALAGESVSLGFPGQEGVIPDLDGVGTGGTAAYTFTPAHAGTFLYEAGLTPNGARQTAMGMFGPMVVEDGLFPDAQEIILVFSELDPAFNANPATYSMINYQVRYWLTNGRAFPDTGEIAVAAGSTVRLRLLNAGGETHPTGVLGLNQTVLASGGTWQAFPYGVFAAPVAAGQTMETLLQIPSVQDGTVFPLYEAGLHQHNNNQRVGRKTAFGGMLTFLRVSGNGTPPDIGPVASNVAVTPSKTAGLEPVVLSATFTDNDTDVVGFEYFIDTLGAAGAGMWVSVPEQAQTVYGETTIAVDVLTALSGGQHTFYVRGRDLNGYWGTPGSAVLTLDKAGPAILGLGLSPNPTNGTASIAISGTADDRNNGNSIIVAAQYSLDSQAWVAMNYSPLNSTYAGLSATIPAADAALLPEGLHSIVVRAQDEFLNWSDPAGAAILRIDKTGPQVTAGSATPNVIDKSLPLPASVRLNVSITDPMSNGLQSTLVKAEGFINTAGAPDTGFSMYPTDGLFDEVQEDAYYNIPGAYFSSLPAGEHQLLARGKDKAGNWGDLFSVTITILAPALDNTPPVVTNVNASPNPTAGAGTVLLTATATDTQSNIAGAIWFIGTEPPRKPNYMVASDGTFNSKTENVQASINVKTWKTGTYQISVRAYDAAGNWSSIVTITLNVTK